VALVRYRSRRDFLGLCADLARDRSDIHKWPALEKTEAFPVEVRFSLTVIRLLTAGIRAFAVLSDLLVYVALPTANILAIGLYPIVMSRHVEGMDRHGLIGFEVGGLSALLVFLAFSLTITHPLHESVGLVLKPFGLVPGPVFLVCAVALFLLPQLALALLGVWLFRKYDIRVRIIVERRPIPGSETGPSPEHLVAEGM
jgi:hypothetical protein